MKIEITYSALLKALKLTKGFCGDARRPILEYVHIEASNDSVTFIATDSYKGIVHEVKSDITIIDPGAVNVLPKQLEVLLKTFATLEFNKVTLEVTQDQKHLTMSYAGNSFTVSNYLKEYPQLIKLFPNESELEEAVGFDKSNLTDALKSIFTVSNQVAVRVNKNKVKPTIIKPVNHNGSTDKTTAIILPVRLY